MIPPPSRGSDSEGSAMLDPFSKTRDSMRNRRSIGRRSSNSSHTSATSASSRGPTHLLSQCIAILASVVAEDCRFQTGSPRPSRPPNALQSISIDIAQFLIHSHQHDPAVLAQVAFAIIPAFHTFKHVMHARLLAFFDEGLIGLVCADFRRLRSSVGDVSAGRAAAYMLGPVVDEVEQMLPSVGQAKATHQWFLSWSSKQMIAPLQWIPIRLGGVGARPTVPRRLERDPRLPQGKNSLFINCPHSSLRFSLPFSKLSISRHLRSFLSSTGSTDC